MVNETLLYWTKIGFLGLSLLVILITLLGLQKALKVSRYSQAKQNNIFLGTIAFIVFWVVMITILSLKGFFLNFEVLPPRMFFVLILPLVKILYLTFSGRMDHLLSVIPKTWLMYVQAFRIPVELLLWMLLLSGVFPTHLTFEGRNWDIIAGVGSPLVAYLCFVKNKWTKRVAVVWNIISFGLLINIVVMAILTFPTPFQVFTEGTSNEIIAEFPTVFLPAILVVAAFTYHCFSLRQLMLAEQKGKQV